MQGAINQRDLLQYYADIGLVLLPYLTGRARVMKRYKQNASTRTLASVHSPRRTPRATVSAPVSWADLESGAEFEDFTLDNMPARVVACGDLCAPLLSKRERFNLAPYLQD